MCALPVPSPAVWNVTRPSSKLKRLCESAASVGGNLATFAAVARELKVQPSRITQLFGHGVEKDGKNIEASTLERLAAAFTKDGLRCETEWLLAEFDDFAGRLAKANPAASGPRRYSNTDTPDGNWQFTEDTVLPDLVELRLHPPRPGNEMPELVLRRCDAAVRHRVRGLRPGRRGGAAHHRHRAAQGAPGHRLRQLPPAEGQHDRRTHGVGALPARRRRHRDHRPER